MKINKVKNLKYLGIRYGAGIRKRYFAIKKEKKKLRACISCKNIKAKQISSGIWKCLKCNIKFTGPSY